MSTAGKYIDLWTKKLELLEEKIKVLKDTQEIQSLQLSSDEFNCVGDRQSYSFNLEFVNGNVSNNISGSAVARDLETVIKDSPQICNILKEGHFKIKMDSKYCLWIQRK